MRQYTGRELGSITGLRPNDLNAAVRELKSAGAVDIHLRSSSEPYTFTSITLTPKGRVIFQESKAPGCDT
ncbi:hypothetical protein CUJ86_10605 [Methanofollis fontis]|uniref:MarR family transcriptional regulator n=2 Tax=Methanofollis fontis TaxID=2052832 RepID=A0A483CLA8_9EURY|nr:hypothetical protein CUJ86_10605 [Methanofollis fontis]